MSTQAPRELLRTQALRYSLTHSMTCAHFSLCWSGFPHATFLVWRDPVSGFILYNCNFRSLYTVTWPKCLGGPSLNHVGSNARLPLFLGGASGWSAAAGRFIAPAGRLIAAAGFCLILLSVNLIASLASGSSGFIASFEHGPASLAFFFHISTKPLSNGFISAATLVSAGTTADADGAAAAPPTSKSAGVNGVGGFSGEV